MADIGSFGSTIFFTAVNGNLITKLNRNLEVNWVEHEYFQRKPMLEYMGMKLDKISMQIIISTIFGQSPTTIISNIRTAAQAGQVEQLIIGSNPFPNNYVIKSVSEAYDIIYTKGEILKATLDIVFLEYTE